MCCCLWGDGGVVLYLGDWRLSAYWLGWSRYKLDAGRASERGNGGGSTDGCISTMFMLKMAGIVVEVEF